MQKSQSWEGPELCNALCPGIFTTELAICVVLEGSKPQIPQCKEEIIINYNEQRCKTHVAFELGMDYASCKWIFLSNLLSWIVQDETRLDCSQNALHLTGLWPSWHQSGNIHIGNKPFYCDVPWLLIWPETIDLNDALKQCCCLFETSRTI